MFLTAAACGGGEGPAPAAARNLILVTVDTLRADRVGAYGYAAARTPGFDALARSGALFTNAFAAAPITMTSHASLMTGLYPPGHGARHNGMRINASVRTLAESLRDAGFATAAFVSAFPLDRRFGLDRGFDVYGDAMPRDAQGRPLNERPARVVAGDAVAWLEQHRASRFFLWVHFFEPHAPYGDARTGRAVADRYDDEIAEADAQMRRVLDAAGDERSRTLIAVTADHGEAFGEHGEIAHSIFVYDTTLRVPLVIAGPGLSRRDVAVPVSHVDVPSTLLSLLGVQTFDTDGVNLQAVAGGSEAAARDLYAESYAPLLDFGWSPLRALRRDGWKYIEAPREELYAVSSDPIEARNVAAEDQPRARALRERLERYTAPAPTPSADTEARTRLQALGYVGSGSDRPGATRADPKDRRELAAQLARVTAGELHGEPLERALRDILRLDPGNPQAHLRLGYALQETSRCGEAIPHFQRAIAGKIPGADPWLGLAGCETAARRIPAAIRALEAANQAEPGNPVVIANLGVLLSDAGRPADGVPHLQRALQIDPALLEARFHLAVAFARLQRRDEAAHEARELLRRLPPNAPQRGEVERLIQEVSRL